MAILTASKEKSLKIKSPFLRPKPFSKRIEQLKSTLEKRIKNIEYQLKKQHRFDYSSLTGTIICTISAFVFIYSSLCDFAQNYRLNQQYNDLLNELKKNGLQVIDNYNNIPDSIRMRQFIPHIELDSYFSKLPFKYKYFVYPNTPLNKEKIHQLEQIDTKKSNTEIMMLKLEFAIPLLMLASHWFKIAKDPNYDNQYLSKYKQLLKFINHAQKHGYGDESLNSVIDIY